MKFTKRTRQLIGCILLLVFNVPIIVIVGLWWTHYGINPLFPPTSKVELPVGIMYPPVTNGQVQDLALRVRFNLTANSTIAEGVDMTVTDGIANTYPSGINSTGESLDEFYHSKNYASLGNYITEVFVGFRNTKPSPPLVSYWNESYQIVNATFSIDEVNRMLEGYATGVNIMVENVTYQYGSYVGLSGAYLIKPPIGVAEALNEDTTALFPAMNMTFSFPVAGDYSPSIIVGTENDSITGNTVTRSKSFLTYTYDEIKVHVLSSGELQTQELSQIANVVTIALFAFAEIEAIKLVYEVQKGKRARSLKASTNQNKPLEHKKKGN